MKVFGHIVATLLGIAFIVFGLNFFFNFMPTGAKPSAGSPPALFFGAIVPTGFFAFVKVLEIIGGVFLLIPLLRNLGVLIIVPIVVNIVAFKIFITAGKGLFDIPVVAVVVLTAATLFVQKEYFLKLIPCKCQKA